MLKIQRVELDILLLEKVIINMIKNWKIFNESDTYKLNKELIEDYFVPVSDLGYMIYVEYSVYSNYSNKWEGLSELPEQMPITKVGYQVTINFKNHVNDISNTHDMSAYLNFLSTLNNVNKRIEAAHSTEAHLLINDYGLHINFEINPSLSDACYISYDYLKDYVVDLMGLLPEYLSKPFFSKRGNDSYISFEVNPSSKVKGNLITKDKFEEIINKFAKENFNNISYDSIEVIDNKYIIKNLVSTEDINFTY